MLVTVLAKSHEAEGFLSGYTEHYVRVLFRGGVEDIGKMFPVRIQEVTPQRTQGFREGEAF